MDEFEAPGIYQYTQEDIPTYWQYAQQFGLGDNFFSSYPTSSTPNHLAMVAAENGGIYETNDNTGCTSKPNNLVYSRTLETDTFWRVDSRKKRFTTAFGEPIFRESVRLYRSINPITTEIPHLPESVILLRE